MDLKRYQTCLLLMAIEFTLIMESLCCKDRILLRSGPASEHHKQIILDTHNALRQLGALGQIPGQPQASNLQEMKWDDQLAHRALLWSRSCLSEQHDDGRHLPNYSVGQNIATIWTTKIPTARKDVDPDFADAIQRWFDEYRNYNYGKIYRADRTTGHYTQMLWADTHLVGCGYSFYYDPAKGFTKNYICNYGPSGNVLAETPYKIGAPACGTHRMQQSRKFLGLCEKSPRFYKIVREQVPQKATRRYFNNINEIIEYLERMFR